MHHEIKMYFSEDDQEIEPEFTFSSLFSSFKTKQSVGGGRQIMKSGGGKEAFAADRLLVSEKGKKNK